jgi:hypothetical protein
LELLEEEGAGFRRRGGGGAGGFRPSCFPALPPWLDAAELGEDDDGFLCLGGSAIIITIKKKNHKSLQLFGILS